MKKLETFFSSIKRHPRATMPVEKGNSEMPTSEDPSGPSPDDVMEKLHSDATSNEASNEGEAGSEQSTNNQVTRDNMLDGASGYTPPSDSHTLATDESEGDRHLARLTTGSLPINHTNSALSGTWDNDFLPSGLAVAMPTEKFLTEIAQRVITHEFEPQRQKLNKAFSDIQELTERINSLEKAGDSDKKEQQEFFKRVQAGVSEGLASIRQQLTANRNETNTETSERRSVAPPVGPDGQHGVPHPLAIHERLDRLEEQVRLLNLNYSEYERLPALVENLRQRVVDLEQDRLRVNDGLIANSRKQHDDQDENNRRFDENGRRLDEHGRRFDEHGRRLDDKDRQVQDMLHTQEAQSNRADNTLRRVEDVENVLDEMNPNQIAQTQQPPAAGAAGGQQVDVADAADGDNEEVDGAQPVQEGQR